MLAHECKWLVLINFTHSDLNYKPFLIKNVMISHSTRSSSPSTVGICTHTVPEILLRSMQRNLDCCNFLMYFTADITLSVLHRFPSQWWFSKIFLIICMKHATSSKTELIRVSGQTFFCVVRVDLLYEQSSALPYLCIGIRLRFPTKIAYWMLRVFDIVPTSPSRCFKPSLWSAQSRPWEGTSRLLRT